MYVSREFSFLFEIISGVVVLKNTSQERTV
jgi:hypothetical protein